MILKSGVYLVGSNKCNLPRMLAFSILSSGRGYWDVIHPGNSKKSKIYIECLLLSNFLCLD